MAIVWLLFTCNTSFCREPGKRGLLIGFNASAFVGSEATVDAIRYIPGITLGFYQEFEIAPRLMIEPQLLFITKGSRMHTVGELYLHNIFTYLELPVLAKWIINPRHKAKIFLSGGPYMDLKLLVFNEVGFPDEIQKADFGVDLGTGVQFQKISFRIHVIQGFIDIDRSSAATGYRNRTLSFTAGLSF